MNIGPELLWLLLGIAAVLAEVLAVAPGIGLLFTGLGALGVSLLLYSLPGADISLLGQLTWFLAFTAVWAVLLWKPMKRWRMPSAKSGTYSNIVGDRATVGAEGLRKGEQGQVTWSGTVMNAELADDAAVQSVPAGEIVKIVAVQGNTFFVKPSPKTCISFQTTDDESDPRWCGYLLSRQEFEKALGSYYEDKNTYKRLDNLLKNRGIELTSNNSIIIIKTNGGEKSLDEAYGTFSKDHAFHEEFYHACMDVWR